MYCVYSKWKEIEGNYPRLSLPQFPFNRLTRITITPHSLLKTYRLKPLTCWVSLLLFLWKKLCPVGNWLIRQVILYTMKMTTIATHFSLSYGQNQNGGWWDYNMFLLLMKKIEIESCRQCIRKVLQRTRSKENVSRKVLY